MALRKTNISKNLSLPILILVIVCFSQFIYLNSLSNQFAYDDEFTLVDNYFVKTWNNLPLLFSKDYFRYSGELSYRPVVTLSYFIDYTLWKLNPFGFHLSNTLLHTLNSVLLFLLLKRIFNCQTTSFLATLIFSCHPVLTEAVNAISYREDLLATTFFIGAFLLYMKTSKDERSFSPAYFASVVCYLLGIFSKEMAITLPLLIFLYDIIFTNKQTLSYKLTRYYTGYILTTIFYLLMRFVVLHNPAESHVSYPEGSIFINFLTMAKVLASYIKLFCVPVTLCADYVTPYSTSLFDTSFVVSLLFLVAVVVITYKLFFYSKMLFFSIIWFIVSLLPVLNIVPIENIMAERYLCLPIIGFCMVFGNLLVRHHKKIGSFNNSYTTVILLFFILATFSFKTMKQNTVWMDQTVLWTNTARISPNSFKAHNNLGNIYRNTGRLDEAIVELQYALSLYNDYIDAHNNLGVTYRKKGMIKEALLEYQRALQINPHYPYAHNNLGVLYAKSNYLDLAINEFNNAVANKPDYADAYNNLGATYIRKGLYEKAIQECLKAVKYNNRYIDAYYNLGTAYFNNKQLDQALEITNLVLSIDPNHRDAHELLNLIYEQKRLTEKR